ncbi:VRR-NUC domain-containing protein [Acidisphaera sp. S103]|uniref:VRR-NUC domain-containing protein n=1 Tax=Acidisphaera sp. S103 TaxID=1747223 RepID=UPI00131DB714|nr:VRR-NUC domain-containing protein [Acidisphaera sp. S103]
MKVREAIRQSLSASCRADGVKCFPTISIEPSGISIRRGKEPAADVALRYYLAHGFAGDRSRMNVHGYAKILRDLQTPPPWVTVEMEDSIGTLSPARALQLSPLSQQITDVDDGAILARFDEHQKQKWATTAEILKNVDSSFITSAMERDRQEFYNLIALGKILGPDRSSTLYEAVFDEVEEIYEDIIVAAGSPDLLVWSPDPERGFWFFSEVKAQGDSLSASQKAWLDQNWETVQGHYLITTFG